MSGKELKVIFDIDLGTHKKQYEGTLSYGQLYSQVIIDNNDDNVKTWEDVTNKAKEIGKTSDHPFIKWTHNSTSVFGDMRTTDSKNPHILIAEFTKTAIEIIFDNSDSSKPKDFGSGKEYDYDATLTVQAPQTMVVFSQEENNGQGTSTHTYRFTPGNAYFKGYYLKYWTDNAGDTEGSKHYHAGTEYIISSSDVSPGTTLTLYPVFEHQEYNLSVDKTVTSGSFKGEDRSDGGKVYYGDRIKLSYTEKTCTWFVEGAGEIVSADGETYLLVKGYCLVYILYTAFRLNLKIDGESADNNTKLVLKDKEGKEYDLISVGNGSFETASIRGNYTLHMWTGTYWLKIDEFIGIENYRDETVELCSLIGEHDKLEFPNYAKKGSTVTVTVPSKEKYGGKITTDSKTLIVWDKLSFVINKKALIEHAFIVKIVDFPDGVIVGGADSVDTSTYIANITSITLVVSSF